MPLKVFLGKLDANGEALYRNDDSSDLLNDLVIFVFDTPVLWNKDFENRWSKNDAVKNSQRRFC